MENIRKILTLFFVCGKENCMMSKYDEKIRNSFEEIRRCYPMEVDYTGIGLTEEAAQNSVGDLLYPDIAHERFPEVPLYLQQDYPATMYGGFPIRTNGCGITSFAMLASYLADDELTPPEMCAAYGRYSHYNGTDGLLFNNEPAVLGFYLVEKTYEPRIARQALEEGHLVISVQHPGYWTRGGHYIVCESINEEGLIQVRDSNIFNYSRVTAHREDAHKWGNITAGTDLVHRMRGKTAYGLTFPLLLDATGKKFGKSEGNALFMDASMTSVYDWYQYFLRAADADVIRYLKVFSLKSLEEIAALEEQMKANPEARIPQKALAEEITLLVHGEAGLKTAQGATQTLFGGSVEGKSADELETVFKDVKSAELPAVEIVGKCVYAVAAAAGMFKSNGEARRMAQQGGLSLNGAKVDDKRVFEEGDLVGGRVAVLRSGKKNHFLLKVSQS